MKSIKNRTIPDILAFLISAMFSPYITGIIFITIITYNSTEDLQQFLPWMITFVLFAILIPGLYVLWQVEIGKISDLHISHQEERKIPFLVAGVSAIIGMILLIVLDAARPVVVVAVAYSINAIIIAFVTQYWKISIHMALLSSISTIILILYGPAYWWLYLLLIPLAWSRIRRKRHTLGQTIAGAILTFVLTTAVFFAFGYL